MFIQRTRYESPWIREPASSPMPRPRLKLRTLRCSGRGQPSWQLAALLLLVLWIVGTLGLVGWGGGALVLLLIGFAILFHGAAWAQLGRGSWARPATRILFLGSV